MWQLAALRKLICKIDYTKTKLLNMVQQTPF